ncbi:mycothiol synthase [Aeromicrobium halocynthiae]|uniref:Mycothiol acetyltransferase n=1 Tax=Aeromicrobium halocynthiae TaxID=560557 RepID=A0ABN2VZH2_9ACTN
MDDLLALGAAAHDVDGVHPFNEATQIALNAGDRPRLRETREHDGRLVGAALRFGDAPLELVVHPEHRRRGHGTELWRRARAAGVTRAWSHGDLPGAQAFAEKGRAHPVRTLLVLRRRLDDAPEPERAVPGITLRTFEEADAEAIIAVNARAFAEHPEQGAMDHADFDRRRAEAWFDPAGLFVAVRDGQVVGFHWTKIEDGIGEVYVVGVDPDAHGSGLGTALTARGVRHLWEQGIGTVDLYVEGDNAPALAVYRRLGFEQHARDVLYATDA